MTSHSDLHQLIMFCDTFVFNIREGNRTYVLQQTYGSALYDDVAGKTWAKVREEMVQYGPQALRVIKNELWYCHHTGVTVYSDDLTQIRKIPKGMMMAIST